MKLVKHLLEQTKTSEEEQGLEALLLKKVRVTYNKCHTFWRGKVISVHKSDVDKQVDAAKVSAVLCGNRTQDDEHGDGDMCLIALLIQLAWLLHFQWGH